MDVVNADIAGAIYLSLQSQPTLRYCYTQVTYTTNRGIFLPNISIWQLKKFAQTLEVHLFDK